MFYIYYWGGYSFVFGVLTIRYKLNISFRMSTYDVCMKVL